MSEDTQSTEAAKKTPAKKTASQKTPTRKTTTRKSVAKPAAKKTTTRKTTTKKTTAAKTASTSKKTTAKSTTKAKKTTTRKSSTAKAAASKTETNENTVSEAIEASQKNNEQESANAETTTGASTKSEKIGPQPDAEEATTRSQTHDEFVEHMKNQDWGTHLKRAALMILFGVITYFAIIGVFILSAAHLIIRIALGVENEPEWIIDANGRLRVYILQMLNYMTFKTEDTPFPFDKDFPEAD